MSYPKTKDEWWASVEKNWDYLLRIMGDQMDMNYLAFEVPGKAESPMTGRKVLEEVILLKQTKNTKLARYFAGAFFLASEKYAHSVPGWGALCDLLSEEHVLYDGQEFEGDNDGF